MPQRLSKDEINARVSALNAEGAKLFAEENMATADQAELLKWLANYIRQLVKMKVYKVDLEGPNNVCMEKHVNGIPYFWVREDSARFGCDAGSCTVYVGNVCYTCYFDDRSSEFSTFNEFQNANSIDLEDLSYEYNIDDLLRELPGFMWASWEDVESLIEVDAAVCGYSVPEDYDIYYPGDNYPEDSDFTPFDEMGYIETKYNGKTYYIITDKVSANEPEVPEEKIGYYAFELGADYDDEWNIECVVLLYKKPRKNCKVKYEKSQGLIKTNAQWNVAECEIINRIEVTIP